MNEEIDIEYPYLESEAAWKSVTSQHADLFAKWEAKLKEEGLPAVPNTVQASLSSGSPSAVSKRANRAALLESLLTYLWAHERALSKLDRRIIYLYAQEGLTVREVARAVRRSKSQIHRTICRIKEAAQHDRTE